MTVVLDRLVAWAGSDPEIRAMILTSSRAQVGGLVDRFSDYDVIVAVVDAERFATGDLAWQSVYGTPLVRWGDEAELHGSKTYFRGVVYEDHVKIDYSIWPEAVLEAIADAASLPAMLDHGHRVLIDKSGVTERWRPPTHTAHLVTKPSAAEYRALVEQFWWDATYVPKALHRGDRFFARSFVLEHDLKIGALRTMLEWRIALDRGWSFAPGPYGRGLERHLSGEDLSELVACDLGGDIADIWDSLFRTAKLFRRIAVEVASSLGYEYPQHADDRVSAYLAAGHETTSPADERR